MIISVKKVYGRYQKKLNLAVGTRKDWSLTANADTKKQS